MNPALRSTSTALVPRAAPTGSVAKRVEEKAPLRTRIRTAFGLKAAPPESAMEAGWRPYYTPYASRTQNLRRLQSLMETMGGEEDGVTWVFACIDLITQEASSWPWTVTRPNSTVILPRRAIPQDLLDLVDTPNEDMTYADFILYLIMDEYLAGNSYWVKDQMNALGQPLQILRLRPEYTQIAISDAGRVIGFVYNPPDFPLPIPFDRDEVVHFKRGPHPRSEYYGMSVIEGIHNALETDLAETEHVIGFFSDGARLSGVLTTNTLSEVQFERFKQQFAEEYAGASNAHKILIAEEGTRFDPITAVPQQAGIRELRAFTKDEILSGFGVPSPMLGGTLTESTYKMEESQDIFSRRMVPIASRLSQRFTLDVVSKWNLVWKIDATYAEPRDHKVERAANMLKAGATINDSRREMNLPAHEEDWADVPVVPQGFAPFGFMTPGGAPSTVPVAEGGNVNGNNPASPPSDTVSAEQNDLANAATARPRHGKFPTVVGFESLADIIPELADRDEAMVWFARHVEMVNTGERLLRNVLRSHFMEIGHSVAKMFAEFATLRNGARIKDRLSIEDLWPYETSRLSSSVEDVVDELGTIFSPTWRKDGGREKRIKDVLARDLVTIEDATRDGAKLQVSEAVRRKYSYSQMQAGFPEEGFEGIGAVVDAAIDASNKTAKERAVAYSNYIALSGHRLSGVSMVEVADGCAHTDCVAAAHAVWSIEEAIERRMGHPGCVRLFLPVS